MHSNRISVNKRHNKRWSRLHLHGGSLFILNILLIVFSIQINTVTSTSDDRNPTNVACHDSSFQFRTHKKNGKVARGYCTDVQNYRTQERCANVPGVLQACPVTCDSCGVCADPPKSVRFKINFPGKGWQNCDWVAEDSPIRCLMTQNVCRATCGVCSSTYPSPAPRDDSHSSSPSFDGIEEILSISGRPTPKGPHDYQIKVVHTTFMGWTRYVDITFSGKVKWEDSDGHVYYTLPMEGPTTVYRSDFFAWQERVNKDGSTFADYDDQRSFSSNTVIGSYKDIPDNTFY